MTTTYDKLDTINDSLNDIKTAIIAKGQTPSGNITTYATAIDNIVQSSPVIQSLSITPTTSAQTITAPSGTDGYSPITVSAVTASIDNNIVASNIVSGVSILGVNGSATVLNGETVNITPSTSAQTITPTSPKNGITQANVAAVTAAIDANITAENIKKDVTILNVTGTYEGSGGGGEFQLTRVKDDNNNEIGTHFMDFTDENGNKYKVVCLDAQYRNTSAQWCSYKSVVTNLPVYANMAETNFWGAKETATYNTQKILDYCTAGGYTSGACSHCRSQSFTINGTTYYGQLPNIIEMLGISQHYSELDNLDPTASTYTSVNFSEARTYWSSTQYTNNNSWQLSSSGTAAYNAKSNSYKIAPVLEIPY